MADKTYKLKFHLSNGTVKEVEFTAPQGPQGEPFNYEDFTPEQLAALKGPDGKSAYEYAKEAGYEGSEEAFAKALSSGSGFQVGDILTTVRTDLGEKWLLCNGEQVSAEDYGELRQAFPYRPEIWKLLETDVLDGVIRSAAYGNGYWVVITGSNIAYTTNPAEAWTVRSVDGVESIKRVTYVNGYFVLCGSKGYDAVIAYAKDPTGDWAAKTVWTGTNGGNVARCVTYNNGYWVVGGVIYQSNAKRGQIAYSTSLDREWTSKQVFNSSSSENDGVVGIAYGNGYWVAIGSDSSNYGYAYYTTDLGGSWTGKKLDGFYKAKDITFANGLFAVAGCKYFSSNYYGAIAYAADPSSNWNYVKILKGSISSAYQIYPINSVVYSDGCWVVGGFDSDGAKIAYAADLADAWETVNLWGSDAKNEVLCVAHGERIWMAAGSEYESAEYLPKAAYVDPDVFMLPTISTDGAYTYIKALEG